jgi:hypothetical protein
VILSLRVHEAIDPHAWLRSHRDLLYVSSTCGVSQGANATLAQYGSDRREVIVIGVDLERADSDQDGTCRTAISSLRKDADIPWWGRLPESYLCQRLTARAHEFVMDSTQGRVPVWSMEGELFVGLNEQILAALIANGALSEGAEILQPLPL